MKNNKIDTIGREDVVERLYTIIESVSNNKGNTSFALNGVWGSGKTFVIDMLEEKLKLEQSEKTADDKYFVIHYNCWQYDYYEEPLIAIVSAMLDALNDDHLIKDERARNTIKEVFKKIGMALLFLGNAAVKKATNIDVKNTISKAIKESKKIKDNVDEKYKENHKFDIYFDFKKVLEELRNALKQLSQEFTLVFVVDELDRCLPEYSIKVLERLHHLTENVDNTITIIATDKSVLTKTVNRIYEINEKEIDYCSKYLKKFINFSVELDIGESKDNIIEKYSNYINLFSNNTFQTDDIKFLDFFNVLFENIDVREQEIIMDKIMLVHKLITTEEKNDKPLMYLEMIFTIIENYYNQDIYKCFDGIEFQVCFLNGKKSNHLLKLNDVLHTSLNNFGSNGVFVNMHSGIKGIILHILSEIRVENTNERAKIFAPVNYIPEQNIKNIFEKINKFRKIMSIVK